jgi:hypothetical protein
MRNAGAHLTRSGFRPPWLGFRRHPKVGDLPRAATVWCLPFSCHPMFRHHAHSWPGTATTTSGQSMLNRRPRHSADPQPLSMFFASWLFWPRVDDGSFTLDVSLKVGPPADCGSSIPGPHKFPCLWEGHLVDCSSIPGPSRPHLREAISSSDRTCTQDLQYTVVAYTLYNVQARCTQWDPSRATLDRTEAGAREGKGRVHLVPCMPY